MTGLIGKMTGKSTCELAFKASYYNYLRLPFFPLTFTIRFSYLRSQFIFKMSLLRTISLLNLQNIINLSSMQISTNSCSLLTFYQRAVHNYNHYRLLRRKQWKRTITQSL